MLCVNTLRVANNIDICFFDAVRFESIDECVHVHGRLEKDVSCEVCCRAVGLLTPRHSEVFVPAGAPPPRSSCPCSSFRAPPVRVVHSGPNHLSLLFTQSPACPCCSLRAQPPVPAVHSGPRLSLLFTQGPTDPCSSLRAPPVPAVHSEPHLSLLFTQGPACPCCH